MDQTLGGLGDRQIDGSVVVGCAHDQIGVGDQAVGIGRVVVNERAARRFRATDTPSRTRCHLHSSLGAGDLRIIEQANRVFCVVEQFD